MHLLKTSLLAAGFCLFATGTYGQSAGTSSDAFMPGDCDLYICDFQDLNRTKTLVSCYDLSGNTPTADMQSVGFAVGKAWLLKLKDDYASTNYYAGCTSAFTPAGRANAWMVTTPIQIPSTGCSLSWKSESYEPTAPDGLKVFVSTQGGNPETDFTDEPVWQTEAESAGASNNLDGEWNEHSLSLDAYAGQTIWIAFVNQTYNGLILCIDDIRVSFDAAFTVESGLPDMTTEAELPVRGTLLAESDISAFTAYFRDATGRTVSATFDGLSLHDGDAYEFSLPATLPLADEGHYVGYDLWAAVEGTVAVGVSDSTVRTPFVPGKRVVIEEGTGAWCGWCPLGILAIENLQAVYPDNFIPIAVHNDDAMTVADYDSGLRFPTFPMGLVNRSEYAYPMRDEAGHYYFDGKGTFLNAARRALRRTPMARVSVSEAALKGGDVHISAEVAFAVQPSAGDYRVAYVLTEDSVVGSNVIQSNYLADYALEEFGRFGRGGECGSKYLRNYLYMDVARYIAPSFTGDSEALPDAPQAGSAYAVSEVIPGDGFTVADKSHLHAIVLLIDGTTGHIITAEKASVAYDPKEDTGIDAVTNPAAGLQIMPAGLLQLPQGTTAVWVYSADGRCVLRAGQAASVDLSGLSRGIYVVRCSVNGRTLEQKVLR